MEKAGGIFGSDKLAQKGQEKRAQAGNDDYSSGNTGSDSYGSGNTRGDNDNY
jgi:hypothetical protein